jgi:coproporphyrinogen III oxidase-like Fe-S oxidoreductase
MNRDHDGFMSKKGIDWIRTSFPGRTSIDLIFGWPTQSMEEWKYELNTALAHADDHISMYQLTWERGTR